MPTGIYIRSEEARRRMSEAKKGKKHTEEARRKMKSGESIRDVCDSCVESEGYYPL